MQTPLPSQQIVQRIDELLGRKVGVKFELGDGLERDESIGVVKETSASDEALVMFQKCLKIREETLGVDHPSTATSYSWVVY